MNFSTPMMFIAGLNRTKLEYRKGSLDTSTDVVEEHGTRLGHTHYFCSEGAVVFDDTIAYKCDGYIFLRQHDRCSYLIEY